MVCLGSMVNGDKFVVSGDKFVEEVVAPFVSIVGLFLEFGSKV